MYKKLGIIGYKYIKYLGRGGYGEVYKVKRNGHYYALKIVSTLSFALWIDTADLATASFYSKQSFLLIAKHYYFESNFDD